jgi:hypothetical protein
MKNIDTVDFIDYTTTHPNTMNIPFTVPNVHNTSLLPLHDPVNLFGTSTLGLKKQSYQTQPLSARQTQFDTEAETAIAFNLTPQEVEEQKRMMQTISERRPPTSQYTPRALPSTSQYTPRALPPTSQYAPRALPPTSQYAPRVPSTSQYAPPVMSQISQSQQYAAQPTVQQTTKNTIHMSDAELSKHFANVFGLIISIDDISKSRISQPYYRRLCKNKNITESHIINSIYDIIMHKK